MQVELQMGDAQSGRAHDFASRSTAFTTDAPSPMAMRSAGVVQGRSDDLDEGTCVLGRFYFYGVTAFIEQSLCRIHRNRLHDKSIGVTINDKLPACSACLVRVRVAEKAHPWVVRKHRAWASGGTEA